MVLTSSPPVTWETADAAKPCLSLTGTVSGSAAARMATNAVRVTSLQ
ncbi:hypothetical protein [Streptomyces sp. NPDC005548]